MKRKTVATKRQISHLWTRVLTGLILSSFTLIVTWIGGWTFSVFSIIAGGVVFYEWNVLILSFQDLLTQTCGWIFYTFVAITLFLSFPVWIPFLILLVGSIFLALLSGRNIGWIAGGFVYSCLFVSTLILLRGDKMLGFSTVCFLYAVVWGTDIGAYFCGCVCGGPKLAPIWSPKKTWSGAVGGAAIGISAGMCIAILMTNHDIDSLTVFMLALLLSIISQIGDLGESWIKRHFHVKDSGHIFPGHGGILDRVDGLISASITLYIIGSVVSGPASASILFHFL